MAEVFSSVPRPLYLSTFVNPSLSEGKDGRRALHEKRLQMGAEVVSSLRHRPDFGGPSLGGDGGSPRFLSGSMVRSEGPSPTRVPCLLRTKLRAAVVHGGFSGHCGAAASCKSLVSAWRRARALYCVAGASGT